MEGAPRNIPRTLHLSREFTPGGEGPALSPKSGYFSEIYLNIAKFGPFWWKPSIFTKMVEMGAFGTPNPPPGGASGPGHGDPGPGHGKSMPGHGLTMPGQGMSMPGDGFPMPGHGCPMPGHGLPMPGPGIPVARATWHPPGGGFGVPKASISQKHTHFGEIR